MGRGTHPRGHFGTPRAPRDDFSSILDGFPVPLGSLWGTDGLTFRPLGAPGAALKAEKSSKNAARAAGGPEAAFPVPTGTPWDLLNVLKP